MIEAIRERLSRPGDPAALDGDFILNPDARVPLEQLAVRNAAVLVAIIQNHAGPSLLLTRRSASLAKHTGQIAFPGGVVDPEDSDETAAALREAEEEVGLDRSLPRPIGRLPDYITGSGYRIAPVVALVPAGLTLKPNPDEVEEAFEVPLAFLMDPANHIRASRQWQGRERFYYEMPFGRHHIWGVTAGIIRAFYERLVA